MDNPIFISGVGKRVGLHLARSFLRRGIRVIGTYRSERPSLDLLRAAGADLYACDFYDESQISNLTDTITSKYDRLRAIIHNASDWLSEKADHSPPETMRRMMQVHVGAPYQINLTMARLLQVETDRPADIIHIGDYVSGRGSKKHIAYAASKAAQDNLTLSFASALAPRVKVNSIAPALVLFNEDDEAAYREKALGKSLMQRIGGLDEFQRTVDYIMNSHYVTGRVLHLDGGRHLA
jgi:dihydromonapterin reductase/dihydrofolate reductase